ncbi:MAG: 50S ribosomal protein L5 [Halobacteria archaeon]
MSEEIHEMREPKVEKVVVNMAVGEGGRKLRNAEEILEGITGQESVRTKAKQSNPDFGIRKGDPIGCMVTLRGDVAEEFLQEAIEIAGVIDSGSFDEYGNFSFGIDEHTDFEEMDYDPDIGIFGMDVTVAVARKGKRVSRRSKRARKLPEKQRLDASDSQEYIESQYEVEIQ